MILALCWRYFWRVYVGFNSAGLCQIYLIFYLKKYPVYGQMNTSKIFIFIFIKMFTFNIVFISHSALGIKADKIDSDIPTYETCSDISFS